MHIKREITKDCNKVYIHTNEPNLWPANSEGSTGTFTINAGSEKIIKSYALRLFCYDEDGVPTKVKFDN